jgi:hypothetical protein
MPSIIILAIGIGIVAVLLGSVVFQSLNSINEVALSPQEKNVKKLLMKDIKFTQFILIPIQMKFLVMI